MPFTHLRTGAQQTLQSQIDDAANVYKAEILKNRKSTLYGGFLQEYTRALTFEIFFCAQRFRISLACTTLLQIKGNGKGTLKKSVHELLEVCPLLCDFT